MFTCTHSLYAGGRRSRLVRAGSVLLAVLVTLIWSSAARADFGVQPASFTATLSTSQAGAHPDVQTSFTLNTFDNAGVEEVDGSLKQAAVALPAGIIGDATAVPTCTNAQLVVDTACPAASQVGLMHVGFRYIGSYLDETVQLFNMEPSRGHTAELGARFFVGHVPLVVRVRDDGDYGLTTVVNDAISTFPVADTTVTLWGVPADHNGSGAPRRAFLTNPSTCGPLEPANLRVTSWRPIDLPATATASLPDITGCDKLPDVKPTVIVKPDRPAAGAPSGYDIDLQLNDEPNPNALAVPPVRRVTLSLPDGTAISPGSADGLAACTDQQLGAGGSSPIACPAASKIGSVSITTPLLKDPLVGSMYLGEPKPADQYRLFLVAEGSGVSVRLRGSAVPDPATGRLTTTFDGLPQMPFTLLRVHLKGGPRAVLANPTACGTVSSSVAVTPFGGGAEGRDTSSFVVSHDGNGAACPGSAPFAPRLVAGTTNPVAGASSPFILEMTRDDGQRDIRSIVTDLPPGLLGTIAGITRCSAGAAAAGTCSADSRLGSIAAAVGSGSNPLSLPGTVYLTDGYRGGPFGLAFVVPAKVGPFDFGTVVVRAKVTIDPITAALRVESDAMPSIIGGIPLHYRSIRIELDRPGFMRNPSSCAEKAIGSVAESLTPGVSATLSTRFQVGNCASLAFDPHLELSLTGRGQTRDGQHPGVQATVTQPAGQANMRRFAVKLPLSVALDPENAQALCSFADGSKPEPTCPKESIIGTARAVTPILDEPLRGPVYFVQNVRTDPKSGRQIRTLPALAIPLKGQGVSLIVRATSSVEDGQLITTFAEIPDAPVSRFKLNIAGGEHGILAVSNADICKANQLAGREVDGHNGKQADGVVHIATPGCRLQVLSRTLARGSVTLRVGGLRAGKLRVSGPGITTTTRRIRESSVATIAARLTRGGREMRDRGQNLRVRVSFDPAGASRPTAVSATVRGRRAAGR
jgi:hypothetical protein